VVKIISHKTASPLQTYASILFARWHQCTFPCGHRSTNPNDKSINSAVLAQHMAECPYTYNGIFSPPKLPIPNGYLDHYQIHELTWVLNTHGTSIGSVNFAGLTNVTDRQTDHATQSVTTDRIYVRSTGNAVCYYVPGYVRSTSNAV